MTGSKVSSRARMYERTFLPIFFLSFFLSPILSSPPFSPSHVHAPFVDIPWHVLDPFRKMLSSQLGEERKLKWYHSVTKEEEFVFAYTRFFQRDFKQAGKSSRR